MATKLYGEGDWIVHANYGVGQVMGLDTKTLDGKEYKFLIVEAKNCKYWLPVDKMDVDRVRPVSTRDHIEQALKLIRKKPAALARDYKVRAKQIASRLAGCSLLEQARLIRDLHGRRLRKKSSVSDDDVLFRLKKRFVDEWVVSADIDRGTAEETLEEALEKSAAQQVED